MYRWINPEKGRYYHAHWTTTCSAAGLWSWPGVACAIVGAICR